MKTNSRNWKKIWTIQIKLNEINKNWTTIKNRNTIKNGFTTFTERKETKQNKIK